MEEEKQIMSFKKKLDKVHQRLLIPKFFVDKYGEYYNLNVYKNKIEIIPITEEEFRNKKN